MKPGRVKPVLTKICSGLVASCTLAGCASVVVDDEGRTHVAGLVWLTLPAQSGPAGGAYLRTRALGFSLVHAPAGSGLVLGYRDDTLAVLLNDALVRFPPDSPTAARSGEP